MKAADIRAALKRSYAAPNWAIVFEVAQSTGFSANRHLDAVAMDLWPSRGLELRGIEIKVDRRDWKRELNDGQKAEEIAKYLDTFYVAAPKGIVPKEEVPLAWGLIEIEDGAARVVKTAVKTESRIPDRKFLAALMRASTRTVDPETLDALMAKNEAEAGRLFEGRVANAVAERAARDSNDAQSWRGLVAACGENPSHWIVDKDFIAAVVAVRKAGVASSWRGLRSVQKTLGEALKTIEEALGEMKIPEPKPEDVLGSMVRRGRVHARD